MLQEEEKVHVTVQMNSALFALQAVFIASTTEVMCSVQYVG